MYVSMKLQQHRGAVLYFSGEWEAVEGGEEEWQMVCPNSASQGLSLGCRGAVRALGGGARCSGTWLTFPASVPADSRSQGLQGPLERKP